MSDTTNLIGEGFADRDSRSPGNKLQHTSKLQQPAGGNGSVPKSTSAAGAGRPADESVDEKNWPPALNAMAAIAPDLLDAAPAACVAQASKAARRWLLVRIQGELIMRGHARHVEKVLNAVSESGLTFEEFFRMLRQAWGMEPGLNRQIQIMVIEFGIDAFSEGESIMSLSAFEARLTEAAQRAGFLVPSPVRSPREARMKAIRVAIEEGAAPGLAIRAARQGPAYSAHVVRVHEESDSDRSERKAQAQHETRATTQSAALRETPPSESFIS